MELRLGRSQLSWSIQCSKYREEVLSISEVRFDVDLVIYINSLACRFNSNCADLQ